MRLTAKKRAVVPASLVRQKVALPGSQGQLIDRGDGSMVPQGPAGEVDLGEDLFIEDPTDVTEGGDRKGPFQVLEYTFDAAALVSWQDHVVETICQRCDIVPQFIGKGEMGSAHSGTALRVRLLPTVNAAESKARPWDDWMPTILKLMQLVEALPPIDGGLGIPWTDPAGEPAVERENALPQDASEEATRLSTLRTAELLSIEQGVREQHRDWSDDEVQAEVERIREDQKASAGPPIFAGGNIDGGGGPAPPTPPAPGG